MVYFVNGRRQRAPGRLDPVGPYRQERDVHFYSYIEVRYLLGKGLLRAKRRTLTSESDLRPGYDTFGLDKVQEFRSSFENSLSLDWIRPDVWGNEPY